VRSPAGTKKDRSIERERAPVGTKASRTASPPAAPGVAHATSATLRSTAVSEASACEGGARTAVRLTLVPHRRASVAPTKGGHICD
jgi:hypothetical protein